MDRKKLETFRKKLEKRKEELDQVVYRTQVYGRETESGDTQDLADMAASSYTKEFFFSKSDTARSILQLVSEAIQRIEDESYGECLHCMEEVQQKRLEAVPWARHCIACQELLEKGLLE
ncbi:MAG: TraR/DksA family transcriptional regulator [Acidobacteria bacterium]|nr:TraR/DksA family transcriptional regulator [Acidobacteriota bacterium]MBI3657138.1 TraR/DksA family transcriptional regulator [Acidobacteriota bacterium]